MCRVTAGVGVDSHRPLQLDRRWSKDAGDRVSLLIVSEGHCHAELVSCIILFCLSFQAPFFLRIEQVPT